MSQTHVPGCSKLPLFSMHKLPCIYLLVFFFILTLKFFQFQSRSSSGSPFRRSASPRTSRKRSISPKRSDRRSASPYDGSRRRHYSRQSLSPSLDSTVRSVITKRSSPSPEPKMKSLVDYSHSPPPRSRKRTTSNNSSSSSSSDNDRTSPEPSKRKKSMSPSHSVPSPTNASQSPRNDSPVKKERPTSPERRSSPDRTLPEDDKPTRDQEPKDTRKRHSFHISSSKKRKSHRRSDTSEGDTVSPERERKSKVPPKAATLSTSIYGKVASFTDMKVQQGPETAKSSSLTNDEVNGKLPNGSKPGSHDDAEDVEADLRAEFLNNNDALYDSHERMQAAGFPLVSKKKAEAEKILDDLPIDPLRDGHQYVSNSVEKDFALSNGSSDDLHSGTSDSNDVWTPEMLNKLKVKKEEIIQVWYSIRSKLIVFKWVRGFVHGPFWKGIEVWCGHHCQ